MRHSLSVVPFLALAATIGLTACETTAPAAQTTMVPGYTYNAVPPRLVRDGTGISNDTYMCASAFPGAARPTALVSKEFDCADNTKATAVSWDHPEFFGPVPAHLSKEAKAACDGLGAGWSATGYHPMAQYFDGVASPNGGYYCKKA